MDTITHTLFGLGMYGTIKRDLLNKREKTAFLVTSIIANQIPDSDVIANLTEQGQIMQQMWHRGITHSIFLVPLWAILIYGFMYLIFKVKDIRLFYLALIGVFTHNTLDSFNAWGTGYLEPFSSTRLTFGTISIIDFVFWFIFIAAFLIARKNKSPFLIYRKAFVAMFIYFMVQSSIGFYYLNQIASSYEKATLSANFIPFDFQVITKEGDEVSIYQASLWRKEKKLQTIESDSTINLATLNEINPKIDVLRQWSPFVVTFEDKDKVGIYDPRFIINGESFLMETVDKDHPKLVKK